MGFRRDYLIERKEPGTYVDGRFVSGQITEVTIKASVQPLNGIDLKALPEGNRSSRGVKIYSDEMLNVTKSTLGIEPDVLLVMGERYKLIAMAPNQSNVINHFKYLAILVVEDA